MRQNRKDENYRKIYNLQKEINEYIRKSRLEGKLHFISVDAKYNELYSQLDTLTENQHRLPKGKTRWEIA